MKRTYPVVLTQNEKTVLVFVPDFEINTEGKDFADAIEMARDAIGLTGICIEDEGSELPLSSEVKAIKAEPDDIVTLVDIDFDIYRKKNDMRTVRRNVTLPAYLDYAASESGINVSALLQTALKKALSFE